MMGYTFEKLVPFTAEGSVIGAAWSVDLTFIGSAILGDYV